MEIHDIIKDVIFLPEKLYTDKNVSIYFLLKQTGYFEMYDQINEMRIYEVLLQNIECVKIWLTLSENKRTDTGWYFGQDECGKCFVGYWSSKERYKNEYQDMTKACAAFIKHEIESIRSGQLYIL